MPLGHRAHSRAFRSKLQPERVAPMAVGMPRRPSQREPFRRKRLSMRELNAQNGFRFRHTRLHGLPARAPTPRPIQQRHRPDKLQCQAKGEVHQHLHRWKLGPMLVTARFVRTVEHERIKRRYLEMTKSEEMDELKTRIRARASDRARLAQSIIERILAAPTPLGEFKY